MMIAASIGAALALGRRSSGVDVRKAMRMRGEALEYFETGERPDAIRSRMPGLADGWIVADNSTGIEDPREQKHSKVSMCTDRVIPERSD